MTNPAASDPAASPDSTSVFPESDGQNFMAPITAETLAFNDRIRSLIEATRVADLTAVADLGRFTAELEAMTAEVQAAAVEGERMQVGLASTHAGPGTPRDDMSFTDPAAFFPYSPVLGAMNPISPMAKFEVVAPGEIRGNVTLGSAFNGPPGSVHGGMIALVLDELLGSTTLAHGDGGFTGTLSIRYINRVPLDTEIELHGWVDRTEGRKTFTIGEMRLGETVLARAEGIFIRPKDA